MPRILDIIRKNFTQGSPDTENSDQTANDFYLRNLQMETNKLINSVEWDDRHQINMIVPDPSYDIFLKLSYDPEALEPKERFCLRLKAIAEEVVTESESEEESEQTSDEELIY
jgi:hypothetical protein